MVVLPFGNNLICLPKMYTEMVRYQRRYAAFGLDSDGLEGGICSNAIRRRRGG